MYFQNVVLYTSLMQRIIALSDETQTMFHATFCETLHTHHSVKLCNTLPVVVPTNTQHPYNGCDQSLKLDREHTPYAVLILSLYLTVCLKKKTGFNARLTHMHQTYILYKSCQNMHLLLTSSTLRNRVMLHKYGWTQILVYGRHK